MVLSNESLISSNLCFSLTSTLMLEERKCVRNTGLSILSMAICASRGISGLSFNIFTADSLTACTKALTSLLGLSGKFSSNNLTFAVKKGSDWVYSSTSNRFLPCMMMVVFPSGSTIIFKITAMVPTL